MTMITPSYLGETIEYSSLHACRSTLEDPTAVMAREERESKIDESRAYYTLTVQRAKSDAERITREAKTYALERVNAAAGETQRREAMAKQYAADPTQVRFWLKARMLEEVLPNVNKILIAPGLQAPEIWQGGKGVDVLPSGAALPRPGP